MNELAEKKFMLTMNSDPEAFGCCAAYRACSDAGQCVKPELSEHCAYAGNLRAGNIFYGKSATDFSGETYQEICRRADALHEDARRVLDELLIVFCEYWPGIREYVVRNQFIRELSEVGLFEFKPLGGQFPPPAEEKWKANVLRDLVLNDSHYAPLFKAAQAERKEERERLLQPLQETLRLEKEKRGGTQERLNAEIAKIEQEKPGEKTKSFLRQWLHGQGAPLRDRMADQYRLAAYVKGDRCVYAEELYRDTLLPTYEKRIYRLSPYAEDGLLTDAVYAEEALRRVRFSHGYSEEEKEQRAKEIKNGEGDRQ